MKFSLFAFWVLGLFCACVSAGWFSKKDQEKVKKGALNAESVENEQKSSQNEQKSSQNEPLSATKEEEKQLTLQQKIEAHRHHFLQALGKAQHSDIGASNLLKKLQEISEEQTKIVNESSKGNIEENESQREQLGNLCKLMLNLSLVLMELSNRGKPTTELQQVVQELMNENQKEAQKPNVPTDKLEYFKDYEIQMQNLANFLKEAKDKWQHSAE